MPIPTTHNQTKVLRKKEKQKEPSRTKLCRLLRHEVNSSHPLSTSWASITCYKRERVLIVKNHINSLYFSANTMPPYILFFLLNFSYVDRGGGGAVRRAPPCFQSSPGLLAAPLSSPLIRAAIGTRASTPSWRCWGCCCGHPSQSGS